MRKARSKLALITFTFVLALLLSIIPLPPIAQWFRPEWVALVLIYWVLTTPDNVGMGTAFIVGLLLDGLRGSLMGQYALVCVIISYLTLKLHRRLSLFPLWQQAVCVFLIIGCGQLTVVWVRGLTAQSSVGSMFWLAGLTSMLLWPWLYLLLNDYRRRAFT